jgi:eukaryotic-like serine/threonine-protein kinase
VLARAHLAAGRAAAARAAAAEAMQILAPLGSLEEFEAPIRLTWALALDAAGEPAARDAAIAVARDRLLARAARIREPRWRDGFLTAVPDNRDTLALAARWLT